MTKGRTSLDYCSFLHSCDSAFLCFGAVWLCGVASAARRVLVGTTRHSTGSYLARQPTLPRTPWSEGQPASNGSATLHGARSKGLTAGGSAHRRAQTVCCSWCGSAVLYACILYIRFCLALVSSCVVRVAGRPR